MRSMLFAVLVATRPITWGVSTASPRTCTSQFAGAVLNQSGAVISGTAIQIANTGTGELVRRVGSNAVGRFSVPSLRPDTQPPAERVDCRKLIARRTGRAPCRRFSIVPNWPSTAV